MTATATRAPKHPPSVPRACPMCGTVRSTSKDGPCKRCGGLLAADRIARTAPTLVTNARVPDWTDVACAGIDAELWFPKGRGALGFDWDTPRAQCMVCPVLDACGSWALSEPDPTEGFGMYGGMTPKERDQYRQMTTEEPA